MCCCVCLLKSDVWVTQTSGGGELGDGFLREAAYRGPAEIQEEVERGERHQTGATLLQVSTNARNQMYKTLCMHKEKDCF